MTSLRVLVTGSRTWRVQVLDRTIPSDPAARLILEAFSGILAAEITGYRCRELIRRANRRTITAIGGPNWWGES